MLLLQDVRAQARLSVEDVHELLKASGQLEDRLPARSTLYRKLSGVGLKNAGRLVEAVIGVCVSDQQRADAIREQAVALLHQARSKGPEPVAPQHGSAVGERGATSELIRVQRELIDIHARLAAAVQTAAEAEKEAARSRALVTTLLVLGTVRATVAGDASPPPIPSMTSDAELSRLRDLLASTDAQRDEAQEAARDVRSRLVESEDLIASHAMSPASPADVADPDIAGPREWPTTRTDPVDRTVRADSASRGTARTVPNTVAAPSERAAQEWDVFSSDRQTHDRFRALQKDSALAEVLAEMLRQDPAGSRMRSVIEGAGQHMLDPAHTGRYLWSQLTKTEKTAFGITVAHRMQSEFSLANGQDLDFSLAGHEFDVKFTLGNNWMFPPELQGGLCLVVRADDRTGHWSLGLLRVTPDLMLTGSNRDGKRGLSAQGRAAIHWIHDGLPLAEHALRRLPAAVVNQILAQESGQGRADELFLHAQLTAITPMDLSAVTMQADGAKRARDTRRRLAGRGVLVLSGIRPHDVELASDLDLPALARHAWMSVRLAPASLQHDDSPTIMLDGTPWRLARPDDPETPLPAAALS
ncbi:NaeI family type II restriction endonuclease [Streptomyces goshikiensis]|uniref:NaeI family type II restriction endonuclease n=1 Tax=Streptomyces goshikiensis TaxID=1942 RepID=UPI0036551DF4